MSEENIKDKKEGINIKNTINKKREGEDRIFTMPNLLSLLRILMIPFIYISYIQGRYFISTILVILSGLTDLIDGRMARKCDLITRLGKVLDPIADKLTQLILIYAIIKVHPEAMFVIVIFILKEATMGIYNLYFMIKGNEFKGAIIYGKVSTTIFYICMGIIFAFPYANIIVVNSFLAITTLALIWSWVNHMIAYTKQYFEYKKQGLI